MLLGGGLAFHGLGDGLGPVDDPVYYWLLCQPSVETWQVHGAIGRIEDIDREASKLRSISGVRKHERDDQATIDTLNRPSHPSIADCLGGQRGAVLQPSEVQGDTIEDERVTGLGDLQLGIRPNRGKLDNHWSHLPITT
ncbi:hypothetical protein D3C77_421660 [compost metagenome]